MTPSSNHLIETFLASNDVFLTLENGVNQSMRFPCSAQKPSGSRHRPLVHLLVLGRVDPGALRPFGWNVISLVGHGAPPPTIEIVMFWMPDFIGPLVDEDQSAPRDADDHVAVALAGKPMGPTLG